jgi:hypothetical protein
MLEIRKLKSYRSSSFNIKTYGVDILAKTSRSLS